MKVQESAHILLRQYMAQDKLVDEDFKGHNPSGVMVVAPRKMRIQLLIGFSRPELFRGDTMIQHDSNHGASEQLQHLTPAMFDDFAESFPAMQVSAVALDGDDDTRTYILSGSDWSRVAFFAQPSSSSRASTPIWSMRSAQALR